MWHLSGNDNLEPSGELGDNSTNFHVQLCDEEWCDFVLTATARNDFQFPVIQFINIP